VKFPFPLSRPIICGAALCLGFSAAPAFEQGSHFLIRVNAGSKATAAAGRVAVPEGVFSATAEPKRRPTFVPNSEFVIDLEPKFGERKSAFDVSVFDGFGDGSGEADFDPGKGFGGGDSAAPAASD